MPTTTKEAGTRHAGHAGISDAAVKSRTGKDWDEWFALLDRDGAKELGHPAIARFLSTKHTMGSWWAQMITVAYEQARGRRVRHQKAGGVFAVSASRTIAATPHAIWKALSDAKLRRRWVSAGTWDVRSKKAPERMRLAWGSRERVEFRVHPKGDDKCQVVIDHGELKDAKSAASTKRCWARALEKLQSLLEGNE